MLDDWARDSDGCVYDAVLCVPLPLSVWEIRSINKLYSSETWTFLFHENQHVSCIYNIRDELNIEMSVEQMAEIN